MNALAPRADEGRGKLRKATGSCKQTLNRRSPNGTTHLSQDKYTFMNKIVKVRNTGGTETSNYPEEKKENSISSVAASERDTAQPNHNVLFC